MSQVYLSTGAFLSRTLAEVLAECDAQGIRHVELSSGVRWDEGLLDGVWQRQDRMNYLVHNYFPPPRKAFVLNLASSDPAQLTASREHCRAAIDLAAELGNPFYSVHSGFAVTLQPEMLGNIEAQRRLRVYDYDAAFRTFVESLSELCRYAESRGLRFLIENNVIAHGIECDPMRPPFLMARPEELESLFAAVGHPGLGLLFDVAHAKVSARTLGFDPLEFLEGASHLIAAFHLSDNDGRIDNNQPFSKDAWFAPALRRFPDVPMIIEVYRMQAKAMHEQIAVLHEILAIGS
ncbi:MAG TPA: sugar phosphate isomerase/epimerase family protein [Alteraurantiacibacter sp.]